MAGTKISAATTGTTAVGTDRIPIYRVGQSSSDKFYITPTMVYAAIPVSTGITNTAGTLTANLSTGVSGGQSVVGGTASGNSLTLSSTSNGTKGTIILGSTIYNEVTNTWNRSFIAQVATTGTVPSSFTNTAAAHTSLTSATARIENNFIGASQQWVAGTTAVQIFTNFGGFTLTGASASASFTRAYNVFIEDLTQGSNAILTTKFALGLAGNINFTNAATIRSESSLDLSSTGGTFTLRTGAAGDGRLTVSNTGIWFFNQIAMSSGSSIFQTWTSVNHTGLIASTEVPIFNYNLSHTVSWSTGALALQREVRFQMPTYAFGGASTLTRAVGIAIGGPPKAGTNATITTSVGLDVETRDVSGGSGVGTAYAGFFNAPTGATINHALGLSGNLVLATAGNKIFIKEGTDGSVGQTTLVSGTKAITINGLTTSSRAFVTLVTPSGVTLTTTYQAVCTANTLTIQANVAAGTINTADGSTLNYIVIEPAA